MAAGGEIEAHEGVAGLQQRQKHRLVHLAAGVRLHVGKAGAEQFLGALDRQRLGDVDPFAAAVIARARIALGVFVGHHRALRFQHRAADDVFRGDQLDLVALAAEFALDGGGDLGIGLLEGGGKERVGRGSGLGAGARKGSWAKYLHRRNLLGRGAVGHVWRSKAALARYHIRRRRPSACGSMADIYARYGGDGGWTGARTRCASRRRSGRAGAHSPEAGSRSKELRVSRRVARSGARAAHAPRT